MSLAQGFPNLYSMAVLKNGLIKDHMSRDNGRLSWDLHLRRDLNDWEVLSFSSIMLRLERAVLGLARDEDQRLWIPNLDQGFSAQSFYNITRPRATLTGPADKV